MFKKILHANDGSEGAFKALTVALDIASQYGAELHMVCVEQISDFPEMIEEVREEKDVADRHFRNVLKRALSMAKERGINLQPHILTGHPVHTIVDLAATQAFDLVIIGATGHTALYRSMVGSRADRIVHQAPCAVLVVK